VFKGGRTIRDYQVEGLNWMMYNWHQRRNCILAPLSTLGHWKREVEDWCDMRSVYYHDPVGGAEAR